MERDSGSRDGGDGFDELRKLLAREIVVKIDAGVRAFATGFRNYFTPERVSQIIRNRLDNPGDRSSVLASGFDCWDGTSSSGQGVLLAGGPRGRGREDELPAKFQPLGQLEATVKSAKPETTGPTEPSPSPTKPVKQEPPKQAPATSPTKPAKPQPGPSHQQALLSPTKLAKPAAVQAPATPKPATPAPGPSPQEATSSTPRGRAREVSRGRATPSRAQPAAAQQRQPPRRPQPPHTVSRNQRPQENVPLTHARATSQMVRDDDWSDDDVPKNERVKRFLTTHKEPMYFRKPSEEDE